MSTIPFAATLRSHLRTEAESAFAIHSEYRAVMFPLHMGLSYFLYIPIQSIACTTHAICHFTGMHVSPFVVCCFTIGIKSVPF